MSSGTLVNFSHSPALVGFGAQLTMLDCKMSSSLSPATPVNILSECYINMWENEMAHPPPTKLESTDIMDLIEPNLNGATTPGSTADGGGGRGGGNESVEVGSTSPTTTIHHTGSVGPSDGRHHPAHQEGINYGPSATSPAASPSVSSPSSSSSSTSSSSQYLAPLPSLGDPYCATATECQLLDGFHSGMEPPFHKLSDPSHAFQDGGYDAFISDLSQQPPLPPSMSNGHHHHHHQHHSQASHLSAGAGLTCHDNSNGVLLLDMSNHHPHHLQPTHGGQCSPGCACGIGHPYHLVGDTQSSTLELCHPGSGMTPSHNPHSHNHHHHPPPPNHHHHPHQQDYSSSWDDLQCEPGDYSIFFRKGESPSPSDCISNTDNDSESKSSGGSLSGINDITHVSPPKRKVGRPPKKDKKLKRNEKKTGRLWEFIRDLLKNPEYCPSLVKWENHEEGHFRFVNSEKVAQLWGDIKGNPRMTYEKLSRAMRYYYKSHVFEPVLGRRLVYKFGYNATNWKPINPNFASSHHRMYN